MWILATAYSRAVINVAARTPDVPAPPLDKLMLFGFMSAVFTLVCLAHVHHYRSARLLLACSLVVQAAYGFLFGVWPISLVALVGAGMATHWWWKQSPYEIHRHDQKMRAVRSAAYANALSESRLSRMFRSTSGKGSVEDN